jgi:hypothetical protein
MKTKRDYRGATIEIDGMIKELVVARGRVIVRGECSRCNHTLDGQKRYADDPSSKAATVSGAKAFCGHCDASYAITFAS